MVTQQDYKIPTVDWVRSQLAAYGLTQKDLARELEVDEATISRALKGDLFLRGFFSRHPEKLPVLLDTLTPTRAHQIHERISIEMLEEFFKERLWMNDEEAALAARRTMMQFSHLGSPMPPRTRHEYRTRAS